MRRGILFFFTICQTAHLGNEVCISDVMNKVRFLVEFILRESNERSF